MRTDKNTLSIVAAVVETINRLTTRTLTTRIIDLGCSDGQLLHALRGVGYQNLWGVGYDVRQIEGFQIVAGVDLCVPGFPDSIPRNDFDIVIGTEVIEHLVNPYQFLANCRELLKANGALVLTFPNIHNLRSIIGYALQGRYSGFFGPNFNAEHPLHDQHIWIPNMHLVRYFMKLNGLAVDVIQYVNGFGRLWSQTTLLVARAA